MREKNRQKQTSFIHLQAALYPPPPRPPHPPSAFSSLPPALPLPTLPLSLFVPTEMCVCVYMGRGGGWGRGRRGWSIPPREPTAAASAFPLSGSRGSSVASVPLLRRRDRSSGRNTRFEPASPLPFIPSSSFCFSLLFAIVFANTFHYKGVQHYRFPLFLSSSFLFFILYITKYYFLQSLNLSSLFPVTFQYLSWHFVRIR